MTLVTVHPKRGREALADIGVLAGYAGTLVHDGYASYDIFAAALHAQCGAHVLRHGKDVGQADAFALWASEVTGVLMEAKAASETAADAGRPAVEPDLAAELRRKYNAIVDAAFTLLPPGPKAPAPPHRRVDRGPAQSLEPGQPAA